MIKNKILPIILSFALCSGAEVFAKENGQYPNISGKALFEFRGDRITSANKQNINANNADINIDTNFNLNFNKNWSLVTNWRFAAMNRQSANDPERYRKILSKDRHIGISKDGLAIDELKGQFENEDARFFFGKFNPEFGSAFRKEKRIGVFTTDFTKDYELRGKIGAGFTALLEHSELTMDAFFNDTTELSNSAIHRRGAEKRSDNLAGNTSTPTSYTIAMKGQNLFGVSDLFYNLGYRNLDVDNAANRDNETGFVGGLEYLFPLGLKTSLIPFIEVVSINNLSGISGRDATYITTALIGKYSNWTASISNVRRAIKQKDIITGANLGKINDHQLQYSVGYKFDNNVAIDLSRAAIKEDGQKASLIGVVVSYIYNF